MIEAEEKVTRRYEEMQENLDQMIGKMAVDFGKPLLCSLNKEIRKRDFIREIYRYLSSSEPS